MSIQLVLFIIFTFLLIITFVSAILFFVVKKYRRGKGTTLVIFVVLVFGLIFLAQDSGEFHSEIGPLKVTIKKWFSKKTDLEIANPTDANIREKIIIASTAKINAVDFGKNNKFSYILDGGVGEKYVVLNINIPPNETISGSIASASEITVAPIGIQFTTSK